MTIKECIDIVDNIKPNQYTIKDKVMWLSFIEEIIINEVLKTHEGYDGRYDDFSGYTEDKISVVLIVPSPYDRLYTEYLKMMIDKENGEVARYNNSAASYNTYMMEYKKHYNKTHMPLSSSDRRKMMPAKKTFPGLTDAEYENIKKDMTYILTEYFEGRMSNDRIYEVVNSFVQNNIDMLKGKAGYTPIKGVDYFNEADMEEIRDYLIKTVPVSDYNQNDPTQPDYIKNRPFYTTDSITVLDIPNVAEVIGIKQPYENYELQLGDIVRIVIGNSDKEYIRTISKFPFIQDLDHGAWKFYSDGWVIESANYEGSFRIEIPSPNIKIDPKYIPNLHYVVEWDEEINETFVFTKENCEDGCDYFSDERPIGIVEGNIYNVHVEVTKDGAVIYNKEFSVEPTQSLFGSRILQLVSSSETEDDEFFDLISIHDATCMMWAYPNIEKDHINLGFCSVISEADFDEMKIVLTGKGKHPVLKLLPKYITPEGVQSNYNQNDPTQPDYIKNRPFYEDTLSGEVKQLKEKFIPDSIARKDSLPVIFNTTKVYDEEINGATFPDTKFYSGNEYTVEVWQGEELLDSFTAVVKGESFGSADGTGSEQIIGGLSIVIAMAGSDYVNFGFVGVGGEYHVKIYEKSHETNSGVISALSGFFVQQIDSTSENPVQLHDLADGVYVLRGEFANSVQLFNNPECSFAILTHLGDMWSPIQLLHTNDFVTVYKTVLSTYGDILVQELVSPDNEKLLTREKDVASDTYSASDDSLLTKEQIENLIYDYIRTPKTNIILDGNDGFYYSIQIVDGQLTANLWSPQ